MILIVDDSEADARLIIEAMRENGLDEPCEVASNGEDCLSMLRAGSRPRLMVLDLNMPKMGGIQVIKEVKADPALTLIPVVVLTTSDADKDILESYRLHANHYITKPIDIERFIEVVGKMYQYWFDVGKLPNIVSIPAS